MSDCLEQLLILQLLIFVIEAFNLWDNVKEHVNKILSGLDKYQDVDVSQH